MRALSVRFKGKDMKFTAYQFDGTLGSARDIRSWGGINLEVCETPAAPLFGAIAPCKLYLRDGTSLWEIHPQDYVLRNEHGKLFSLKRENFEALYNAH